MMIYFHCSDLHVTCNVSVTETRGFAGRLGFGEGMFVFILCFFLIQCNEMEIICSMLMMMLVSKERKSTRFFHSFFDLHSDITKAPSTLHRFQTKTILFCSGYGYRPHYNVSFRKHSPQWNDLKTVLFENAVFLVWTAKTILSENDDVTTTTPPGCRPLNMGLINKVDMVCLSPVGYGV